MQPVHNQLVDRQNILGLDAASGLSGLSVLF
jgi:hypothetical protein